MLRANVHVSSPDLVLSSTRAAHPDFRYRVAYQAITGVIFLTVDGDDFDSLERSLDEDDTVADYVVSAAYEGTRIYKVTLDVDRQIISGAAADYGISVSATYSDPGDVGWTFELLIPDREALVALREFCTDHDMGFRLNRLFYPDGVGAASGEFGLTEKQRHTLLTAHENGYFDVPRGISQQELADMLESSPTAVSQRLRRAVARLVENTVGQEPVGEDES